MTGARDISRALISEQIINDHIPAIFINSIILDNSFTIRVISDNVVQMLGYTNPELRGKHLNTLSDGRDLEDTLRKQLTNGFFDDEHLTLVSRKGSIISMNITGFYLGLVTDINNRIVLMVKQGHDAETIKAKPAESESEMDKFVYRVAHDLRGPLATIKGLINLMKLRQSDWEVDHLIQLIDAHATQLDDRLFHLVYLTQTEYHHQEEGRELNFNRLETRLRQVIERNAFIDFLEFDFTSPKEGGSTINSSIIWTISEHLLLHMLSMQPSSSQSKICYQIRFEAEYIRITLSAVGFGSLVDLDAAITNQFTYTDLIRYPQLTNFFAAHKLASQKQAKLKINSYKTGKQAIVVKIPLATCSLISAR